MQLHARPSNSGLSNTPGRAVLRMRPYRGYPINRNLHKSPKGKKNGTVGVHRYGRSRFPQSVKMSCAASFFDTASVFCFAKATFPSRGKLWVFVYYLLAF